MHRTSQDGKSVANLIRRDAQFSDDELVPRACGHRGKVEEPCGAIGLDGARLPAFKELAVEAAHRVAARHRVEPIPYDAGNPA